jgi:hypothetical protein
MLESTPRKSSWVIYLLSAVLFFLFAWLFAFVIDDINDIDYPDRSAVFAEYVDADLDERRKEVESDLRDINSRITSTSSSLENVKSATGGENKENIKRFSDLLLNLESEKNNLLDVQQEIQLEYGPQFRKYEDAFDEVWSAHRFTVAVYKLLFVVPLFVFISWQRWRRRESALSPIYLSAQIAAFWHLGVVANDHFPEAVFKYIAIFVGIAIIVAILVNLLGRASNPKDMDLLKLRRKSYANSICPNCAFPIRNKEGKAYTCPGCGTALYSECSACPEIRHTLLPHCSSCGITA